MAKIPPPKTCFLKKTRFWSAKLARSLTATRELCDAPGAKRGFDRTRTFPMPHMDRPRPITFIFLAVRAVYTVGVARLGCTGRGAGGGTRGTKKLLLGTTKTVAWRGRVGFLAVAEKTRGTRLLSKQKLFCAPTQLKDCKDITVWDSSILCPKVVQRETRSPLFFC